MSDFYLQLKDKVSSIVNKKVIIVDKQVFLYNKIPISSGHYVYVPPTSKYEDDENIDEVIFIPKTLKDVSINSSIGIMFIFSNNLNIRVLSKNPNTRAISNIIYTIHQFTYSSISNSIIIKEISDKLFPEEEIRIKGNISEMRSLIEDYVDDVLSTFCYRIEPPHLQ